MRVGVVGNPRYPQLGAILHQVARDAGRRRMELYTEPDLADIWERPLPQLGDAPLDALLTFGGDGTLLRGARLLAGSPTPILGVNLGRVGFLTTATRATLDDALDALVAGDYDLELRQALESSVVAPDGTVRSRHQALNDVVVHGVGVARVVRLDVLIDGESVGPYSADGIIVATPTGSTAYSLSAGGPIVVPGVQALLVTPICAHTLAVRPLLVPAGVTITLVPLPEWCDEILVSTDGQVASPHSPGDRVIVRRAEGGVSLVRLGNEKFFSKMRRKLHWGDLSGRELNENDG